MNWLIYKLKILYRYYTNHCRMCGFKIIIHNNCYHCKTNKGHCHSCSKLINHSKNYGYYAKPHGSGYIEVIK